MLMLNKLRRRRLISLWLMFALLGACTPSPTATPTPTSPLPTPIVVTTLPSPTPPPTPRSAAEAYLAAWQAGDYAAMYALLASESQSAIAAADFEKQYRDVMGAMTATVITATVTGADESGDSPQVHAHVKYTTVLVGTLEADITLPLKRTSAGWGVAFNPALIWPDLVNGQKLYMAPLRPDRGSLYDRNGAPMVKYTDAYAIGLVPGEIEDEGAVQGGLGRLLGVPGERILARYEFAAPDQYLALAEVGADEVEANRLDWVLGLAGVKATPYTSRYYYGNGAAAHVTGYTAFIPEGEFEAYRAKGYFIDQRVGATGLEAWGEEALAGRNGGQLILLDADNNVVARLTPASQPAPSQDIYTTVDFELQQAVQFALGDFTGAAVVLDRNTGEVLALASSPTFDPNLLDPANLNFQFADANLSGGGLNRAAQGSYPAGSVFKVVTMAAGLTSGLFAPDTEYTCTGTWEELGPSFVLNDWKEGGHGTLTLTQGLSASCNPWFWHVGKALFDYNPAWLSDTALGFGLGQPTGIEIDETPGQIPGPEWKQQNRGEAWTVFDNLNLSIGQGDVLVTPLQIARAMAAVGNGGTLYQPQLVLRVQPADGGAPTFELEPIPVGQLPLSAEQLAAIQEGMYNVTQEPIGTARNRFRGLPKWLKIAGKTGTAEDPGAFGLDEPDAWFAGYTFADRPDQPDIAIAVVVANQGQGSDFAAPIFRRIVESYFGLSLTRYPWESSVGVVAEPTPTPQPGAEETPTPQP
jgi:penicillin-binding protein 2